MKSDEAHTASIATYVRVRPFSDRQVAVAQLESAGGNVNAMHACMYCTSSSELVVDQRIVSATEKSISRDLAFTFDRVLWSVPAEQSAFLHPADSLITNVREYASQSVVYDVVGKPMVSATLNGVNSCIFAFGQTGSGKSHTVFGSPQEPGLAPRIAAQLFADIAAVKKERLGPYESAAFSRSDTAATNVSLQSTESTASASSGLFSVTVSVGMFEIYNEKITDLLARSMRHDNLVPLVRTNSNYNNSCGTPPHCSPVVPSSAATSLPTSHDASFEDDVGIPVHGGLNDDEDGMTAVDSQCASRQSPTNSASNDVVKDSDSGGSLPRPFSLVMSAGAVPPVFALSGVPAPQPAEEIQLFRMRSAKSASNLVLTGAHGGATDDGIGVGGNGGLRIRHDPTLGTYVEGLRKEIVDNEAQMLHIVNQAMKYRVTAKNHIHDVSSRSHAILFITVTQEDKLNGTRKLSCMHLVDLAGSERGARYGASGQQLAESKKINLSLTTLRRVIDLLMTNDQQPASMRHRRTASASSASMLTGGTHTHSSTASLNNSGLAAALGASGPGSPNHLPLRDSKLTEVMAECFGGNCLASMIATVSPHELHIMETLDSLRYCTKAKGIVNRVRPNEEKIAVAISGIQLEIDRLKKLLHLQENDTRLSDMARFAKRRANVMLALEHCITERRLQCDTLQEDLQSLNTTLTSYQSILLKKLPQAAVLEAARVACSSTHSAISELQVQFYQSRKMTEESCAQSESIIKDIQLLEATPVPPIVMKYLACKKRCARMAFCLAAREYKFAKEKESKLARVQSLRRECKKLEEHAQIMDASHIGSAPEWESFWKHSARCRDIATALGVTYETFYQSQLSLKADIAAIRRNLQNTCAGELREATAELDDITSASVASLKFAASLVCTLQEEIQLSQRLAADHDKDVSLCDDDSALLAHQIATLQDELSRGEEALTREAQRKATLLSDYSTIAFEVRRLEEEIAIDSNEVMLLDDTSRLLAEKVREHDASAQEYAGHLLHAEHAARVFSFPDAKPQYQDTQLASAAVALERVNNAVLLTPRRILGSLDRASVRSFSQDTATRGTATQHHHASPAPLQSGSTPLVWKHHRTPLRGVPQSPTPAPATPEEAPMQPQFPTEDF